MRAQRKRFRVLRIELGDQLAPQQPACAQLGDLHEEVHPDAPEEREPRGELVDGQPRVQTRLDVLHTIGQRVGQLQIRCRTGLLDVIAGDRDRVELRHSGARVAEDVGDDPHRRLRRIDVGVADHELFEDVVLDRPRELLRRHTLFLGGNHIQREDRQHRAVHRHRDRHRRQIDTVEQLPHIQDGIDCHTGHSDVARDAGMVGVVPAVRREVERDRQPLLPGGEVPAIERIGFGCRGEPGVLPDRPRLVDVHRRIRPAQVRGLAGEGVQRITGVDDRVPVGGDVHRLDVDAFRRRPRQLLGRVPVCRTGGFDVGGHGVGGGGLGGALAAQRDVGEAADSGGGRSRAGGDIMHSHRSCPQSGEQVRQRADRVDLGGQVVVGFVIGLGNRFLGSGQ